MMKNNKMILGDPQPVVATTELADFSVNIQLKGMDKDWELLDSQWGFDKWILETFKKEDMKNCIFQNNTIRKRIRNVFYHFIYLIYGILHFP